MADEQFVMSMYANKEALYEAKAAYYMKKVNEIRTAFTKYYRSEGCGCCQDNPAHKEAEMELGELLNFNKYSDDSGYDFYENEKL